MSKRFQPSGKRHDANQHYRRKNAVDHILACGKVLIHDVLPHNSQKFLHSLNILVNNVPFKSGGLFPPATGLKPYSVGIQAVAIG